MKQAICTIIGMLGSGLTYLFGGWDSAITTLCIFMIIDFASGLIVAGVFHKSSKTESGTLKSESCFKGLCKKVFMLLFVVIANRLDLQIGTSYIRDMVCIAFIVNELISIVENAGLMGLPIPSVITKAIDILKEKENTNDSGTK